MKFYNITTTRDSATNLNKFKREACNFQNSVTRESYLTTDNNSKVL